MISTTNKQQAWKIVSLRNVSVNDYIRDRITGEEGRVVEIKGHGKPDRDGWKKIIVRYTTDQGAYQTIDDHRNSLVDVRVKKEKEEKEEKEDYLTCPRVFCDNTAEEPHVCPFKQDIEGNSARCTCCKECKRECAADI